jgi:hypothetical protein
MRRTQRSRRQLVLRCWFRYWIMDLPIPWCQRNDPQADPHEYDQL